MVTNKSYRSVVMLKPAPMSGMNMLTVNSVWAEAISAWDTWLRSAGKSSETRYTRSYHLRRLAHDHPDVHPWKITEDHLVDWMGAHKWKPETRRSYRSSLRVFFRWAQARGHITVDPAHLIEAVKVPRAKPRPCPNDVAADALDTVDPRVKLMLLVLVFTGVRRGELCRMHTNQIERNLHGWQLRVVGKGGHERLIPIDEHLAATLRLLPHGWFFPGQIDGHLSASYVGKLVSRAMSAGWTAHTLRHRYATLVYAVERDIRATQELLGHASVVTTQIYTYVPEESLRRAAAGAGLGLERHAA